MKKFLVTLYRMVGEYAELEVEVKDEEDEEEAIKVAEVLDCKGEADWQGTGYSEMDPESATAERMEE